MQAGGGGAGRANMTSAPFARSNVSRTRRCGILRRLTIERTGDWVTIEVTANAFLHHMARNLVGALLAIGLERAAPESARAQLESRVRDVRTATAAAAGLYLWRVEYPPPFALPADCPAGAAMAPDDSAIMGDPLPGWPQLS